MNNETQNTPAPYTAPEITDLGRFVDPSTVGQVVGSEVPCQCE